MCQDVQDQFHDQDICVHVNYGKYGKGRSAIPHEATKARLLAAADVGVMVSLTNRAGEVLDGAIAAMEKYVNIVFRSSNLRDFESDISGRSTWPDQLDRDVDGLRKSMDMAGIKAGKSKNERMFDFAFEVLKLVRHHYANLRAPSY